MLPNQFLTRKKKTMPKLAEKADITLNKAPQCWTIYKKNTF